MKPDIQPHEGIREYLLGQSTSEDSVRVEERLWEDDDVYQELLIVEDELVDQYLAGLLTNEERESFENHFAASPDRREKLRFARNLKKYVSRVEADRASVADDPHIVSDRNAAPVPVRPRKKLWIWPNPNPIPSYALAAAVVIAVALAGIMIFRPWNAPPHTGKALAVELVPGLSRGEGGIEQITVPADTETVQLQLRASNISAYQTYRAILQTADGREISRYDDLKPDPASSDRIICPIPAALLKPGNYSLKLSGLTQQGEYEDIARYYLRVNR